MTIVIDCRMINASGIGVYLRGCLPFFFNTGNFFFLLGKKKELVIYKKYSNVKIIDCNVKPFSLNELFFFLISLIKQINKTDLFYSPYFNIPCGIKTPIYTTIHDIIFPDIPEITSKIGLFIRMQFFRRAYKKSNKIFTVSKFSKSRIEHHLGYTKPVIVTYSAIQHDFTEKREQLKYINKNNTIIFIGNIKKHKGLNCLLDAFIPAKKEGLSHKLVIIGSKDNFRTKDNSILNKINEITDDSIQFTGFVSDNELMEYIAKAALLVQPSLYEGFGLPPLEAMFLGTPVLISDIPVFKEIYDDFPVTYFKSDNPLELKDKLLSLLKNNKVITPVLSKEQLSKYTFKKTAEKILKELN
ncbi:MAG: glycosyltransferase family 4 protein [Treponema sp.]|nr:glycosyltransferase family 4 protein [Treponema sp.]